MRLELKPGVFVRSKSSTGEVFGRLCKISDKLRSPDWNYPGYLGEGFYSVVLVPHTGEEWVMHEDDIQVVSREKAVTYLHDLVDSL